MRLDKYLGQSGVATRSEATKFIRARRVTVDGVVVRDPAQHIDPDTASVMLEIPAGKLDFKGEDPEDAVRRELREETGALCGKLTNLGYFYSSPAILDEKIHMYLAEDLSFGDVDPDEDEFIETLRIPLSRLVEMVMANQIPDCKTQAAVMRAAYLLEHRS